MNVVCGLDSMNVINVNLLILMVALWFWKRMSLFEENTHYSIQGWRRCLDSDYDPNLLSNGSEKQEIPCTVVTFCLKLYHNKNIFNI